MKSLPEPSFLAYLDLVCCAMGAGLLLFLIAVSATPVATPTAPEGRLLAVRCVHQGGERLEVGIEIRRPGSAEWVRLLGKDQIGFVAPTDAKSGAEACLILLDPAEGVWEFQPYLVDIPTKSSEPPLVKLEVYGHPILEESESSEEQTAVQPPAQIKVNQDRHDRSKVDADRPKANTSILIQTGGHGKPVKVLVRAPKMK